MKLNLGCGTDERSGWTNVDLYPKHNTVQKVDLLQFPWPWESESASEIMMLDVLEHFPYSKTDDVLLEVLRVLEPEGKFHVQVPDFEQCALAALGLKGFLCHVCGNSHSEYGRSRDERTCENCGTPEWKIAQAAIHRLYGGQDNPGNFHYNAFTKPLMVRKLKSLGFSKMRFMEHNQNGETYEQNWNFYIVAEKGDDSVW